MARCPSASLGISDASLFRRADTDVPACLIIDGTRRTRYNWSMLSDILIRRTVESDLPAVTAIYGEAVSAGVGSYELEAPDVTEMTRRWRSRVSAGYPHIVAVVDDVVVGFSYAGRFRTRPAYRFLVEDSIYVAPDARGTGVGRELLTKLIKLCEEKGYRQMIALIAGGKANLPSVGLHDHLGFRQVGLIEGSAFKHGRWIDTLLMQRALGEGRGSLSPEFQRSQSL